MFLHSKWYRKLHLAANNKLKVKRFSVFVNNYKYTIFELKKWLRINQENNIQLKCFVKLAF